MDYLQVPEPVIICTGGQLYQTNGLFTQSIGFGSVDFWTNIAQLNLGFLGIISADFDKKK